jgi:hypothetical protein
MQTVKVQKCAAPEPCTKNCRNRNRHLTIKQMKRVQDLMQALDSTRREADSVGSYEGIAGREVGTRQCSSRSKDQAVQDQKQVLDSAGPEADTRQCRTRSRH